MNDYNGSETCKTCYGKPDLQPYCRACRGAGRIESVIRYKDAAHVMHTLDGATIVFRFPVRS